MFKIVSFLDYAILLYWYQSGSLDNILQCGDKLYQSISKTNLLLQVQDIGPQITAFENTHDFYIGDVFYGKIRKDQSETI